MNFSIWYAIPSANPLIAKSCLKAWQEKRYQVAVLASINDAKQYMGLADVILPCSGYNGYPWAVGQLLTLPDLAGADIIITGGDDLFPDPAQDPQDIAKDFFHTFHDGFGVLQPIGDGHGCEEICGSPWMGRDFLRRINQGRGPFWPEYRHYYCDREMKLVAEKLGILCQRGDLVQRHDHWSWTTGVRPTHMVPNHLFYESDRTLFEARQKSGFPGHEPLAIDG
jgi:hypothetical protein